MDKIPLADILSIIAEWLKYFKQRFIYLLIAGILGASIGLIIAVRDKAVYTASLSFAMEEDKGGGIGGAFGLASQFGFDLGGSGGSMFSGDNLLELMKSRYIIEKTLKDPILFNGSSTCLADLLIENKQWGDRLAEKNYGKPFSFSKISTDTAANSSITLLKDSVVGVLYKAILKESLSVFLKDKKLSIIIVNFKSTNELLAKTFVEKITSVVAEFYTASKTKKAKTNLDILQFQTDSVRRELIASISGVAAYSDNTFNLNPALNIKRVPGQSKQVDVQANTAVLTELIKNLELAKVTLRKETPLFQIIDRPILPLDMTKLGKTQGVIMGGLIGLVLALVLLILIKFYKDNFKKQ